MRDHRSSHAPLWVRAIGALWLLTACGRGSVPTSLHSESRTARVATTTSTSHLQESDDESDHAEHTGELTPARSAALGLQGPGRATPLTEQLWSDAQAVAARFVLVDTTYSASEDAAAVNARRSAYATPRLTADLTTSSSGGARLEDLRRRQGTFVGQIEALRTGR